MAKESLSGKLAVILHADVADSTALVRQDKQLAHERIQEAFKHFSTIIENYQGHVVELRGDALLAEFEHSSEAVSAALSFQMDHTYHISRLKDDLRPTVRVGITLGEVIVADGTLTGAGVVQAQRIEQMADPGGVCITAAVNEALSKCIPFELDDLGEQMLKGFDIPVRVYRVELRDGKSVPSPEQEIRREPSLKKSYWPVVAIVIALIAIGGNYYWFEHRYQESAAEEHMTLPLPDKPSIAVLPFTNMSGDSEQEYFVDGMTEDLITDLSKISGLFVIARNSVFTYKGKAVKIQQVAKELAVRYILEGSVRRVGNQVRINAQLIDSNSGGHIWADRYDGTYEDVFALQDKVTGKIVATLAVTLTQGELERVGQKETANPKAYDTFLKGWEQYLRQTPENFHRAITHFKQAIKLDPQYSRAYAALSATYWHTWKNYLADKSDITPVHQFRYDAENYLDKAMENPTPLALQVSSAMHAQFGRHEQAIEEGERAIALDPNAPEGYVALAGALNLAGQSEKALTLMERAMRLDPHYPPSYLQELALARFGLENFEEAAIALKRSVALNPDDRSASRLLIATLGHLGRTQEAKAVIEKMDSSVAFDILSVRSVAYWYPYKNLADAERLAQGLRKAGLPD